MTCFGFPKPYTLNPEPESGHGGEHDEAADHSPEGPQMIGRGQKPLSLLRRAPFKAKPLKAPSHQNRLTP